LAHAPSLSQYVFSVATTQEEIKKKTWNEPKFVLPLHRRKEQNTSSDTKREFKNYNSINNLKFKKGKELWQRLQL
jgi:hypothetical protein